MSDLYGVVYVFTCSINGKKYVGQTTNLNPIGYCENHLNGARKGHKKLFYNAIRKHGEQFFTYEIIAHAEDKISLDFLEDMFIYSFNCLVPNGYNLKGGGSRGKLTDMARANLSLVCLSPDTNARKRAAATEVNSRPGLQERKSKTLKTTYAKPEVKAKFLETLNSPERLAIQRANSIQQFSDPEFKVKFSDLMRETMNDPVVKARHKAAYDNPETKKKLIAIGEGTSWINNGIEDRRLHRGDPLPDGWRYGTITYGSGDPLARQRSQSIGRHKRWHVNRNIVNPDCALCAQGAG